MEITKSPSGAERIRDQMKRSLSLWLVVLAIYFSLFFTFGCENDGRTHPEDTSYSDQSYVCIDVRNLYWCDISVYIENTWYTTIGPGMMAPINYNLIGNEDVMITVMYLDVNGKVISAKWEVFDRKYSYYHLNAVSPWQLDKF